MSKNIWLKILAIFIAIIIWLQQILLSEQVTELNIPIQFINIPHNLILANKKVITIPVIFSGKGKDMILLKFSNTYFEINAIDFKYWNNLLKISDQDIRIPDYILAEVKKINIQKNILIKLDRIIETQKKIVLRYNSTEDMQFFAKQKIIVEPDFVSIKGPEILLKPLKNIETEFISRKDMRNNKMEVLLKNPSNEISLLDEKVSIYLKKTENKKKLFSLIPISFPHNKNLNIIPSKASILIEGPEKLINSLNPKSIDVSLDDKKLKPNTFVGLKISVPAGFEIIEYTPIKVQIIGTQK